HVIIRRARQAEVQAACAERAKRLARIAAKLHVYSVLAQPGVAVSRGDLAREPRAKGAVAVGDGVLDLRPHGGRLRAAVAPQALDERGGSWHAVSVALVAAVWAGRADEQPAEVHTRTAGARLRADLPQQVHPANSLVQRGQAERGQNFAHFLRDIE